MRLITLTAGLLMFTACGSSGFEGSVVDGITGQPLADFKLVAKAVEEVGLTCMAFTATTGADGTYKLDGACVSESAYTITAGDASYWLAETAVTPKGVSGPWAVKAWHSGGTSANLYHLNAEGISSVPTASTMTEETLFDTTEKVQYPKSVPGKVPFIAPGEYLVLNGADYIEKTKIAPMFHSGPRNFGSKDEPVEISNPWWYVGVEFVSDTEFTKKEAQIDATKAVEHTHDEQRVKWLPAEAFAPGRYAMWLDGARRMYIVDIGAQPKKEEKKEEPAAE